MKNYTLVLYKSDGCNTCRGCVMESWGSDFSLDTDLTETQVIESIAGAFTKPSEGGGYEARVFDVRDGIQVIHTFDQHSNWKGTTYSNNTHSNHLDWEVDEAEGNRLHGLISNRVTEILEAQRLSAERAKVAEEAAEEKQQEENARQQYEALKLRYEGKQ